MAIPIPEGTERFPYVTLYSYVTGPYATVEALQNELLGIRAGIQSNSLWSVYGTLQQHAFMALNDGLAQYPVDITGMYHTITPSASSGLVALPGDMQSVTSVYGLSEGRYLPHYRVIPTNTTKFLEFTGQSTSNLIRLEYTQRIGWVPPVCYMADDTLVRITTGYKDDYAINYPSVGYIAARSMLELEHTGDEFFKSYGEEVIHYGLATRSNWINHFTRLTRAVFGAMPDAGWKCSGISAVTDTVGLSFAIVAPKAAILPAMYAAQASLYDRWLVNRADYDKYTAIASRQFYTQDDLLKLINTLEARAALKAAQRKNDTAYQMGTVRLRSPLPR